MHLSPTSKLGYLSFKDYLTHEGVLKFAYDFSTVIPLNLLIIYGKDPNFKAKAMRIQIFLILSCRVNIYYDYCN